jgi:hypothetical protein
MKKSNWNISSLIFKIHLFGKRILLLAIGICFSVILNAQGSKSADVNESIIAENYHPFLNSTWYSVSVGFEGYDNEVYIPEKDTTFNGFSYSKINLKFVDLPEAWGDHNSRGSNFFVREDIPNKRVYRYWRGTGDVLLYDFGLELGATLPGFPDVQLKTIDSIQGPDGLRKRFIFKNKEGIERIWIEGVGNISAPFQSDALFEDRRKLICASQNGLNTYSFTNKDGITCNSFDKVLASNDVKSITPIRIYPNPTSGKIKLVFDQLPQRGTFITVTDFSGKTILKQSIQNMEEWIDLEGNAPGIYFVRTNLPNSKTQKIILK